MKRLILVLVFLVVILGGTTFYFYRNSKLSTINQKQTDQNAVKALVEQVGKLVFLPPNEVPTVATITDLNPWKDKPFFVDAKIGDKVLIFNDAKKAVLYDPMANKIVNIAPVNTSIGETAPATPITDVPAKPETKP